MATNVQGLTSTGMGQLAEDQMKQRVLEQSQQNPGQIVTGGQTGAVQTGTEQTPINFQALTSTGPAPVEEKKSVGTLTSQPAQEYAQGVQQKSLTADEELTKRANDAASLNTNFSTNPADLAALDYFNKNAGGVHANDALQGLSSRVSQVQQTFEPQKQKLAESQQAEAGTEKAAAFYSGQTGSDYGKAALAKMNRDQQFDSDQLQKQEAQALRNAWSSIESDNIDAAQTYSKQAEDLKAAREKSDADALKAQKDALDVEKLGEDRADASVMRAAQTGIELNDGQLSYIDQKYGLDPGTSRQLFEVAKISNAQSTAKDEAAAQTAAVDGAKKLSDYLDSRPLGEPVQIGKTTYYGTGRGDIKTGIEIDKATGQGLAYEYDPSSGRTTTTPMGQVGFADPNWSVQADDNGNLWRISATTGKMLPMTPGPSQKTNNAILKEGSTGPALPGHEANAGQCGAYANYCYGGPVLGDKGNTFSGKQEALSKYPSVKNDDIQSGNTFLMKGYGTTGHIGFVGDPVYDPQGKLTGFMADESNFVPPGQGKVSYSRFVSIDDPHLAGFYDVPTPNKPQVGTDSPITNAVTAGGVTFGNKNAASAEKPLSADEITKYGLDPTDPQNVGITLSDVKTRLGQQQQEKANEPVETPTYNQYGLLANTDFNPADETDKEAKLYLDYYIKNAAFPTSYSLGMGKTSSSASRFAKAASRAQDLYYTATGEQLPDVAILKGNKTLINANNKLENNLNVQEGTIGANFKLALSNIDKAGINQHSQPINDFLNNVGEMWGDPNVAAYLSQNATLANEVGSLLALKNAGGTTVADKLESAKLIKPGASEKQQKAILKILLQEADNASKTIRSTNSDLYKQIDPLETLKDNPNRQDTIKKSTPEELPSNIGETVMNARQSGTKDDELLNYFLETYPGYSKLVKSARDSGKSETEIIDAIIK